MIPDQMVYWLTGEMLTEPMSASCEVAIDLRTGGWAEELIAAVGIDRSLLAPFARPGDVAGRLRPEIAESIGLPHGLPVAIGGHDVEVGAMAVSAGRSGHRYLDVAGTWEILLAHTTEFFPDRVLYERGIDWAPYVNEGEFLAFANMPAGSVLNWIRSLAFKHANWETVAREAEEADVGAGGVRFFPSLIEGMGPYGLQNLPGSIIGIQTLTKRGALVRAAIEALCIQVRLQLELLEETTGEPCEVLRVVGGGHKNDLWLQTKANVLGKPVEIVDTSEATLLGAALLGGVGAGFYPSIAEAQDAVRLNIHMIEPELDCHERYLPVIESYVKIPSALEPLSRH